MGSRIRLARKERPAGVPGIASTKMSDIARLAGVSKSTVSRALAGSPLVNADTRRQIVALTERHGYTIDQAARNLRLQRTGTIAVVFPLLHRVDRGLSDPFFLEMLGHLADELADRHYDLLLRKLGPDQPDGLAALLRQRRVDGMIVVGQSTLHRQINEMADYLPDLVVWGHRMPDSRYVSVGPDGVGGAGAAVRHLIDRGRKRIAFIGDPDLPEVGARLDGYREELRRAGIRFDRRLLCRANFDAAEAVAVIGCFLERTGHVDGVFAASDVLAMAAIRSLADHGRIVPDDVAVVGFDDILSASSTTPALTSVRQDIGLGARLLVETLIARIKGEPVSSQVLPTQLVVRASS